MSRDKAKSELRTGPAQTHANIMKNKKKSSLAAYFDVVEDYFDLLPVNRKFGAWTKGGWPKNDLGQNRRGDHAPLMISAPSDIEVRPWKLGEFRG